MAPGYFRLLKQKRKEKLLSVQSVFEMVRQITETTANNSFSLYCNFIHKCLPLNSVSAPRLFWTDPSVEPSIVPLHLSTN